MTLIEAQAEYADASATYAAAKAAGDAQTIIAAKAKLAEAQAAIVKAKATQTEEPDESKVALKKAAAEWKDKYDRLLQSYRTLSGQYERAQNKIDALEWALREAKGEKIPNFGAQIAVIPTSTRNYPKLNADDLMQDFEGPEWDAILPKNP